MHKHLFLFCLSGILTTVSAKASLPFLEDYQFSPSLASIIYGSPDDKYKLLVQYFGEDESSISGRHCELDQKGKPFNCISIRPDLSHRSCYVSHYKEGEFDIAKFELSERNVKQALFSNGLDFKKDNKVAEALEDLQLSDKGSARTIGMPAPLVVPYYDKIEDARAEYWKTNGNKTAETVYLAKLACHEFFKSTGARIRFANARKTNASFCEMYNESAKRMGSEIRNCAKESGKTRTPSKAAQ